MPHFQLGSAIQRWREHKCQLIATETSLGKRQKKESTFSILAFFHQFIVLCKCLQHKLFSLAELQKVKKTKII